jgi:RNA polymerase sigma-70 factor (ECF subfamily)
MIHKVDFASLVEAHSRELYVYLWRLLGDEAEAQDALQDTYLLAWKAYERLDADANTRAWLYKIAGNWARTLLKKRARGDGYSRDFVAGLADERKGPGEQAAEHERLIELHSAVMELPDRQREAILMRKYQELDYAEIAVVLDCSEDSARANVYQGLKKLRKTLGEEVQA